MAIEQRFYSTPLATRTSRLGEVLYPAITDEKQDDGITPLLCREFSSRTDATETIYLFGATPENWAVFDARYPNQDADDGVPYRRRYPQVNLPDVTFTE